ncbi:MAG: RnfABCDGE type electron transport complex subunit G [Candidatus Margulisiibacteriota bacterium]
MKIVDYSLRLLIICAVAAGLLTYVYETTYDRIADNAAKAKSIKAKAILPEGTVTVKEFKDGEAVFFRGYSKNGLSGTVVEASSKGYGGPISLLVGTDKDGKVIDIAIASHLETPGLGAKIEEKKFIGQFKGRSAAEVVLKKDSNNIDGIDAITAATISSRAVTRAVKEALLKYNEVKNVR